MAWLDIPDVRTLADIPDTVDDERLLALIEAACGFAEGYCNRKFAFDTYSETAMVRAGRVFVHALPVQSVNSVTTVDGAELDFIVVNSAIGEIKVSIGDAAIVIVNYVGGFVEIPFDLKFAVSELIAFWLKNPTGVTETSLAGASVRVEAFPQRIQSILDKYRIIW